MPHRARILALGFVLVIPSAAGAATLLVHVTDARDGTPLPGSFVQVGPVPGSPFAANSGLTAGDGTILFNDPALAGPQTVTAAALGFARKTVIDAAEVEITLALQTTLAGSGIYGTKAEISGTVTNITTQNNDGNFDLAIVYPSLRLGDLLTQRAMPIEVPADTVNFPIIGDVVLPGNVSLPSQTEFVFLNFSKPNYHFSVKDGATYDFLALAGRIPINALTGPDVENAITMREIGAERDIAVSGNRVLTINSDLNLTNNLTVNVPEAPNGSETRVVSIADIQSAGQTKSLFFDTKTGLADVADTFLLSGRNSSGDLADAVPYVAAIYADSSAVDAYSCGRVDRTPLTLPANRTVGDFFLLPDLAQDGIQFTWSDVARPGITPDPTWAVGALRLQAAPGDSTVPTQALWEVWAPAGVGSFVLPVLPGAAPGGLIDPLETMENDQLVWDQLLSDPAGDINSVLVDPFATATRFSRRWIEVAPPAAAVDPGPTSLAAGPDLSFGLTPNPGSDWPSVVWSIGMREGLDLRWSITDASGRRVGAGLTRTSGGRIDRPMGMAGLPGAGVYWLRLEIGGASQVRRWVSVR